jgi:hypothetical protein
VGEVGKLAREMGEKFDWSGGWRVKMWEVWMRGERRGIRVGNAFCGKGGGDGENRWGR